MSGLKEMLKYVSEHNDFYKNIIREYNIADPTDITQYPILTRKQLQERRYNMFSDGYKIKYLNQQLRRQSSSGSSGIPVNVYYDYKNFYSSMRVLWHKRLEYYGIYPFERYIKFTLNTVIVGNNGISYLKESDNVLNINFSTIRSENDYKQLIEIISEFKPKWLYIQPFVLQRIIDFYQKFNMTPPTSISYIESVGELLPTELKKNQQKFLMLLLRIYMVLKK